MNIRKASGEDISQLIQIRIEFLTEEHSNITVEQATKIEKELYIYFNKHLNQDTFIYLAEVNSDIISTAFLKINELPANPNFITGKTGTLINVYTKPNYRKQGIACKLIQLLLNDAKEMNLSYIDLKATSLGIPYIKS